MSLQTIKEDFLYGLLPEGILNMDQRGIMRAVIGGYQDRIDDLRSYTAKFELLLNPLQEFPETGLDNVVLVTYRQPDQGNVVPRAVILDDTTPKTGDYPTIDEWEIAAKSWVAERTGIPVESQLSVELAHDPLKSVDSNTLQYLAATVGAVLYKTSTIDADKAKAEQRRVLAGYFPRLKIKGTARSFDVLGRLLTFGDVKMTPLWTRVSPRLPNDIGNPVNDPDFRATADFTPQQHFGPTYDPLDLTDGPFYSWESPVLSTNPKSENFYTQGVNGYNPFVKVVIDTAGTVQHPGFPSISYPQTFVLAGGGPHKKAEVVVVPSGPQTARMRFEALAEGASFNGLQIVAQSAGSLRISDAKLSSVKFRSSFYNLSMTVESEQFVQSFGDQGVQKNPDLSPADGGSPTFCFDGTAVSPFRPWAGGVAGTVPRAQASPSGGQRQLDLVKLNNIGVQATQYLDEVRAATRFSRKVLFGFMVNDAAIYAAFPSRTILFTSDGVTLSASGTASGFPLEPYSAIIVIEVPDGFGGYTTIVAVGEEDLLVPTKVNYLANNFSGSYDFATSTYSFTFNSAVSGTRVVARWSPASTEVIRPEPSLTLKSSGSLVGYQARAEDSPDLTANQFGQADEYPWRRDLVGGGETADLDVYLPTKSDLSVDPLEKTMVIENQAGAEFTVDGFDLATPTSPRPIRLMLTARPSSPSTYAPGQPALGIRNNRVFHVGSANGVLVADLSQFYGTAHSTGLVGWVPFNQHPDDLKVVLDHSRIAGDFQLTGTLSSDRLWDTERGWNLKFSAGAAAVSDAQRSLIGETTIAFWIKPGIAAGAGSSTIFELGSTRVLSGSIQEGRFYRVVGAGSVTYNAKVYQESDPNANGFVGVFGVDIFVVSGVASVIRADTNSDAFNAVSTLSADLTNTGTPSITWYGKNVSTTSVGTRVAIASVNLTAGVFNFVYLRRSGTSFSLGVNTLASTNAEIVVSSPVLTFGPDDTYLKFTGSSRQIQFHDFRLWNVQKTETELKTRIRVYPFKTTVLAGRPTYVKTLSRGERWGLQVLDTGLVFPVDSINAEMPAAHRFVSGSSPVYGILGRTPIKPGTVIISHGTDMSTDNGAGVFPASSSILGGTISYSTGSFGVGISGGTNRIIVDYAWLSQDFNRDKLARVQRYDANARYHGDSKFEETGLGGGLALPGVYKLGTQLVELTAGGSAVVSTQHSALPGVNALWSIPAAGSFVRVKSPYTSQGGATTVVSTGTASPWPNLTVAENPGRARVWVKGDNDLVYEVVLEDTGYGPALRADLYARRRSSTELLFVNSGSLNEDKRDQLELQEVLSGAEVQMATSTLAVSVREILGALYPASRRGIDTTIAPTSPTAPSFKGKVRLKFNTSELLEVHERVALVVNTTVAGLQPATYWGTVTKGVTQSNDGYDVEVKLAGLSVGQYNPALRTDSTNTASWSLYRAKQEVYQKSVAGTVRPPTYLYLHRRTIFSAQGTEVYNNWDDPTALASDHSYATRADAGLISFTNAGSIASGPHTLTLDAGNIGRVDTGFSGFDVDVTIGNTTVPMKLVPQGRGNNPRATQSVELNLDDAVDPWTLSLDWTNDRDIPEQGYQRQLAIFGYRLERVQTALYRVDVSPFQVVNAGTAPGGLVASINSYGTVSRYNHESNIKPDSTPVDGPTGYKSSMPIAGLLTASTARRREDIVLKSGGTTVVTADGSTYAGPAISLVTILPP